jgi:negative regulator of genetic competence, sporulation and motility
MVFPVGRIRYDELKRYLAVYDLKKAGMKYSDIIKKIGTKSQKELYYDLDIQSQFRRDFRNAKRIIKNAEKGYFPISDK